MSSILNEFAILMRHKNVILKLVFVQNLSCFFREISERCKNNLEVIMQITFHAEKFFHADNISLTKKMTSRPFCRSHYWNRFFPSNCVFQI